MSRCAFFLPCPGWYSLSFFSVRVGVCVCVCTHACPHVCSVLSDSLWPHGLKSTKLLCPWNFPGKNTGVDCHFLLQWIFLIQGSNLCLLHWQVCLLLVEPPGKPMCVCMSCAVAGRFFTTSATWETFLYLEDFINFCPALDVLWVAECLFVRDSLVYPPVQNRISTSTLYNILCGFGSHLITLKCFISEWEKLFDFKIVMWI